MIMHPAESIKGSKGGSLKGKHIVLGVTGSIGAVKSVELARELIREGAEVTAAISDAAKEVIHPNALHFATGREVIDSAVLKKLEKETGKPAVKVLGGDVEHIKFFGKEGKADLLLIVPCTANTIGKIAQGVADSVVSVFALTALGAGKKIIVAPVMNNALYDNPVFKENADKLRKMGVVFLEPVSAEGKRKFPEIGETVLCTGRELSEGKLRGKKVLVSSGAVEEAIDPVRVLTSRSSGITGREIARQAYREGADVAIVHNKENIAYGVKNLVARSSEEMREKILQELEGGCDVFVSAAAVSDFRVEKSADKISSGENVVLELKPTEKIISEVRGKFPELFVVGFKAETNLEEEELVEKGEHFMRENNLEMVVANDVGKGGIGENDNEVFILGNGSRRKVSGSKRRIAKELVGRIANALETV